MHWSDTGWRILSIPNSAQYSQSRTDHLCQTPHLTQSAFCRHATMEIFDTKVFIYLFLSEKESKNMSHDAITQHTNYHASLACEIEKRWWFPSVEAAFFHWNHDLVAIRTCKLNMFCVWQTYVNGLELVAECVLRRVLGLDGCQLKKSDTFESTKRFQTRGKSVCVFYIYIYIYKIQYNISMISKIVPYINKSLI